MSRQNMRVAGAMRVKSRNPGPAGTGNPWPGAGLNRIHEGKGNQVRQVADCGKLGVMRFGRHFEHVATQRRPDVNGLLQRVVWVRRSGSG